MGVQPSAPLELWGGIECTYNRVGEHFFDQTVFSGHDRRLEDLTLLSALGLRTVRYPVLWEKVAPDHPETCHWQWTDERLKRLRELQIEPIAGLVHHGSGPRYTSLIDPQFPEKLAAYARKLAERYPWLRRFTPVNEPLTTARFSGLYGHWYPHGRDSRTFARCLLAECWGTVLAMKEIRRIRPDAQLVLTEDIGHVGSTPRLAYQATHENERRWLSIDLLCGRVHPGHPLWEWLSSVDADRELLQKLADEPCPPDIIGMNHYLTSNRYLDENLSAYPAWTHGGNGREAYADVEAVRVAGAPQVDRVQLLETLWTRYGRPLAITECHLGATREEQLRWLHEMWSGAQELRGRGVDVRAVTVWSLLGVYDWSCLVTRCEGRYEPGAFDLRGATPRPTALAKAVQCVSQGVPFDHPVVHAKPWWQRPLRSLYPPATLQPEECVVPSGGVLITGARGTLGRAFARLCHLRGIPYTPLTREQLDIANATTVRRVIGETRPWAVINTAGYVRVDDAENDRSRCYQDNVRGPLLLAQACAQREIPFVTFSSDLVFDGLADSPYTESSPTSPLNLYGKTKREAELAVQAACPTALIVRTSAFFGPWDAYNFVTQTLQALAAGQRVLAADDLWVSPTYVPDLVNAVLDLLIDGEKGLWHLATPGQMTWLQLAQAAAERAGMDVQNIEGRPAADMGWTAARPRYSVLGSERGVLLDPFDRALSHYFDASEFPIPVGV